MFSDSDPPGLITAELLYFTCFRPEKRKLAYPSKENGSGQQRKVKREKKYNAHTPGSNKGHLANGSRGGLKSANRDVHSDNAKSLRGQSEGRLKKSQRGYNAGLTSDKKRKQMELTNMKKDEAGVTTHYSASKSRKHQNLGKKRLKINK